MYADCLKNHDEIPEEEEKEPKEEMEDGHDVIEDIGTGKGMLSTVKLINAEQYGGHVVRKKPGSELTRKKFSINDETFCRLHNTEVDAYTFLQKYSDKNILHPRVYDSEKMDLTSEPIKQGFIIMEHMKGVTHMYCHDNLKPNELVEGVKNLARFHSIGAELTKEESSIVPRDFLKSWFTILFTDANKELFIGRWKGEMTEWLNSEKAREAIGELDGILSPKSFEQFNDDCQIQGVQEVLCHGDSSFHNLLFEKLPDGSHKFRALIDFQSMNWGNAAQDLSRLFVTSLNGKDRRESEERLLRVYHEELTSVNNGKAPFTWDQLKESYKRFFQLHAAIVCSVTTGLFQLTLDSIKDENEKDKFRDKMMEKYVALLEDIYKNIHEC